jgi:hypothetical protein
MSSRVHATERFKNLICYVLGSHNEAIVGCFFEKNSLNASLDNIEDLLDFFFQFASFSFIR